MRPEPIITDHAPAALGAYAQGMRVGEFIYTSGQLAIDPATGDRLTGDIEQQTERVLRNMLAVVEAGGGDAGTVVKTTLYIADAEYWGRVNDVYARVFADHHPARAIVPCKQLPFGFLIEGEAVALAKG